MTPTDEKPMTVEALMTLGADLFAQDATKHAALHEAASAVYAQIRAAIEQYGKEQYARGVNDSWPAGRGSGEPVAEQMTTGDACRFGVWWSHKRKTFTTARQASWAAWTEAAAHNIRSAG